MNLLHLKYYPRLRNVLTEPYRDSIIDIAQRASINLNGFMNIYSFFIDVVIRKSDLAYSALDIHNSEECLNKHAKLLVGFIYSELDHLLPKSKYGIARTSKYILNALAQLYNMELNEIKLSTVRVSADVQSCIELYQKEQKNDVLLDYYSGWVCESKGGQEVRLHLAPLYDAYGSVFTNDIYQALFDYAKTQKLQTLKHAISNLTTILSEFTRHCKTLKDLKLAMKAEHSTVFMFNIFNAILGSLVSRDGPVKGFFQEWANSIAYFTSCFIERGVFEEPLSPFICPVFKEQISGKNTEISMGGKLTKNEQDRFFLDIPLEIKDEKVIEIIKDRVDRDIQHIRIVSTQLVHKINVRHNRNINFIKNGHVKISDYRSGKAFEIGLSHLKNTVATFYDYNYEFNTSDILSFLGCVGQKDVLLKELNLPTPTSLCPFLISLVLEHPKITPSWLDQWELFDKNGNMVGFKQVGKQWVAVSLKHRRGTALAQQEVILTEHSIFIVKSLIKHTKFVRESLRKLGGDGWRYMIITSSIKRPVRLKSCISTSIMTAQGAGVLQFITDSFIIKDGKKELVLSKEDAEHLAPLITLRNVRKNRGLQVYLKTESVKAMSEALGHKEPNLDTLKSYLPDALLDFFNARWIRIFQNAIIFEALKDSPYLIEALDFSAEKLEEFLDNHRLGELPTYLKKVNESLINEDNQHEIIKLDELVFTMTIPLLQVLIAISVMVKNASEDETFMPVIQKWYESAIFILNHFTLTGKSCSFVQGMSNSLSLYEIAIENPLDIKEFKGNFLCH